ncbi:MAG: hypothetical protein ACI865_002528 [Flavobacteriaceae bacterium]|jgi:hypothetical protein
MKKDENDILKKGILKPTSDFTSGVMGKINAEEKALANVLSAQGGMKTSSDFTSQLMAQIGTSTPSTPYVPVISKRVWIGIAAVFIGVLVLAGFYTESGSGQIDLQNNLQKVSDDISASVKSGPIFTYLLVGALILSLGLFIEQRFGKKV